MTTTGTAHFRTGAHARRYYQAQEGDEAAARAYVREALEAGAIHLGAPPVPAGAHLLEDAAGRYHLQTIDPAGRRPRIVWDLWPSWYVLDMHAGTEHRVGSEALGRPYPRTRARYRTACGADPRRLLGCLSGSPSGRPACPECSQEVERLRQEEGAQIQD